MTQLQSSPGTIGCRDHGGADAPCRGGSAGPAAELAKRAARMAWILKHKVVVVVVVVVVKGL